jgi:hypothetical protein
MKGLAIFLATCPYALLLYIFLVGWSQSKYSMAQVIKYVVLAPGIVPWLAIVITIIFSVKKNVIICISLCLFLIPVHFYVNVLAAHGNDISYITAEAVEIAVFLGLAELLRRGRRAPTTRTIA